MSLTRISGADLRTKEYRRSPFALWRRMRDEQPLLYDEVADCWVLSRYDDVVAVLNDPGTYSAQTYQERFRPVFGRTFAELDGRKQIRERTIVAPTFVGRSLDELGPLVEQAVSRSAAALAGVAAADLVETTSHIPIAIIAEILGFPEDEADVLFEMGKLFTEGLVDAEGILAAADAHRRLSERLDPMLDERLSHPADDLITRIASANADGQQLSRDEMFSLISFVLAAGGPTTDLGLRNVWHALLSEPGELEACRADPDRVQRAISETLRRDGPIACEDRRTTTEVEWYGTVIPAGSDIVIILGAANTDDSVFADPEQFDPDRTDLLMGTERKRGYKEAGVAGHLAFGLGTHFCIGYQLARVEIARATEAVLLELPGVRLREPQTLEIRGYERSLRELPVELATTR